MKITLQRILHADKFTLGRLLVGGEVFYTIEKPWKDNAPFKSCIPAGKYICKQYSSKKYPNTYEITDVPKRTHILFHSANYARDVSGCIGIGMGLGCYFDRGNFLHAITESESMIGVTDSRKAVRRFIELSGSCSEFELEIVGGGS